ncbi:hypothetical protein Mapa_003862 [Marchantia paleacea]|nr:hypothetical protein Mapa_003862 [Marchantia paleacea]
MKVTELVFRATLAHFKMSTSFGLIVLMLLMAMEPVQSDSSCGYSGLFAFGDSLTDTGNAVTAFPQAFLGLVLPYGETYFGQPSSRASDGRLTIDFVANSMGLPFVEPYLQSVSASFKHGANFAAAGGTALPSNANPFDLSVQFEWYRTFKSSVLNSYGSKATGTGSLPDPPVFQNALYVISIGGNDYFGAYGHNVPIENVKYELVPAVVNSIKHTLEGLYAEGARNFLLWNVPAQGCSLALLQRFTSGGTQDDQADLDDLGCMKIFNEVSALHSSQLQTMVDTFFYQRQDNISISIADYYTINYEVLKNPSKYGFWNTMQSCCGAGPSRYNYNPGAICAGAPQWDRGQVIASSTCDSPSGYVNWDGVHFTEAMNHVVARASLSGQYLHHPSEHSSVLKRCNFNLG